MDMGDVIDQRLKEAARQKREKAALLRRQAEHEEKDADVLYEVAFDDTIAHEMTEVAKAKMAFEMAFETAVMATYKAGHEERVAEAAYAFTNAVLGLEYAMKDKKFDRVNVNIHRLSVGMPVIS